MSNSGPRSLKQSEIGPATDLLAETFEHDPLMLFLAADKGSMLQRPWRFYEANIRLGLRDGRVDVLDDMHGIAVWLRPGRTAISPGQLLRSGMLRATLGMGFASVGRFMAIDREVRPMTKRVVPDAYWLLLFLAVHPARQGQGLGGTLIAPVLDQADEDGVACYLESGNELNLAFYERRGFEVADQVQVPNGPKVWGMIRAPRTR